MTDFFDFFRVFAFQVALFVPHCFSSIPNSVVIDKQNFTSTIQFFFGPRPTTRCSLIRSCVFEFGIFTVPSPRRILHTKLQTTLLSILRTALVPVLVFHIPPIYVCTVYCAYRVQEMHKSSILETVILNTTYDTTVICVSASYE